MTRGVRISRQVFYYLAILFMLGVVIQVLLAGMAIFVDPARWRTHTLFISFIEFIPIIMLILAFIGRLPNILRWHSFGLFLMIIPMYMTANLNIPIAGAFHPVLALLMFWLSITTMTRARRSLEA